MNSLDDIWIRYNDTDIRIGDIKTAEDALAIKAQVHADVLAIQGKLDEANANLIETGEYADADWYRRAKAALKWKKFALQRLQEKSGEFSKKKKLDNVATNERQQKRLIEALRSHVGDEVFMRIVRSIDDAPTQFPQEQTA